MIKTSSNERAARKYGWNACCLAGLLLIAVGCGGGSKPATGSGGNTGNAGSTGAVGGGSGTACGAPGEACCAGNVCNGGGCCINQPTDAGGNARLCTPPGPKSTRGGGHGEWSARSFPRPPRPPPGA